MLNWFKPKCPLSEDDKLWVESRLSWMANQFGLRSMLRRKIVLPTKEDFPEPFDGSEASARTLFRRICEYMGVNPCKVHLSVFDDPVQDLTGQGAAGTYSWKEIRLSRAGLGDQSGLAATIAHELGHYLLLEKSDASLQDPYHEEMTDLATVFFGMGIVSANARMRTFARGWQTRGYLPTSHYGHALATLAWARNERPPDWLRHLQPNPRGACKRSLKYFEKTSDCVFLPVGGRILAGQAEKCRRDYERKLKEAVVRKDYATALDMRKRLDCLDNE